MKNIDCDQFTCHKIPINSKLLEIPRNSYQREFRPRRAEKIACNFDERIANEPKVSFRDGHYYVFDGQHTIAARKRMNDNKDLFIMCKVFYGMTEEEEAALFAQQTGISAKLTPGEKLRAEIVSGNPTAIAFKKTVEDIGLHLDYAQSRGQYRIACIGTAYSEFQRVGPKVFQEALTMIALAWDGDPHSLRCEIIQGVVRFTELYWGEYDPDRLYNQLRHVDPLTIYREGQAMGNAMGRSKKYMFQVFRIYNGLSKKNALPMKF